MVMHKINLSNSCRRLNEITARTQCYNIIVHPPPPQLMSARCAKFYVNRSQIFQENSQNTLTQSISQPASHPLVREETQTGITFPMSFLLLASCSIWVGGQVGGRNLTQECVDRDVFGCAFGRTDGNADANDSIGNRLINNFTEVRKCFPINLVSQPDGTESQP